MTRETGAERIPVRFRNHVRDRTRSHHVLPRAPLDAFRGEFGEAGLEPLLSLMADVVDMDLVLVGHVNGDEYTAVASYARRPDFTFAQGGVIPICDTYCREEITAAAPFAIGDAAADPAYCTHPGYVKMGLRAYLGVPLVLEDGTLFGTVCGVDEQPRTVAPEAVERILLLAGMLSVEISRRLGLKNASEAERALERSDATLQAHLRRLAQGAVERDTRIRSLTGSLGDANRSQREAIKRLRTANRELESFTYTISHDLSEPLRGIETLASMLAADAVTAPRSEIEFLARRTQADAAVLRARIHALLDLSRALRADFQESDVDLDALARDVVHVHADLIARNAVRVHVQESPALPVVRGERPRLEQVYSNLVQNAVKHNPDNPGLSVIVGWETREGEVVHFVRDNGKGIPAEWRTHVLEPFRRGPGVEATPGTGVGLSIVSRIVTRHEGRLWIEDSPGGGATVCFTLAIGGEGSATGEQELALAS